MLRTKCPCCQVPITICGTIIYRIRGKLEGESRSKVCAVCHRSHVWAKDVGGYKRHEECKPYDMRWYTIEYWEAHYFQCSHSGDVYERATEGDFVPMPPPGAFRRMYPTDALFAACHIDAAFPECDECGVQMRRADSLHGLGDNYDNRYCPTCYRARYVRCQRCDNDCSRDNVSEQGYCPECERRAARERYGIRPYSYRPPTLFFHAVRGVKTWQRAEEIVNRATDKALRFGFELEVEYSAFRPDALAPNANPVYRLQHRLIADSVGRRACDIYVKSDGSLSNGFEIVSHPMTYDYFTVIAPELEAEWERMRTDGLRSYDTDTCGMHVHLGRNAFTKLAIYKLQRLIYENPAFILKISGRTKDDLLHWAACGDSRGGQIINRFYARKAKGEDQDYERYVACNLRNANTIELRFFKGTLNFETFTANIQFSVALHRYAHLAGLNALKSTDFKNFVLGSDCKEFTALRYRLGKRSKVFTKGKAIEEKTKDKPPEAYSFNPRETHIEPLPVSARRISDSDYRDVARIAIGRMEVVFYSNGQSTRARLDNAVHVWNERELRYEFRDRNARPNLPSGTALQTGCVSINAADVTANGLCWVHNPCTHEEYQEHLAMGRHCYNQTEGYVLNAARIAITAGAMGRYEIIRSVAESETPLCGGYERRYRRADGTYALNASDCRPRIQVNVANPITMEIVRIETLDPNRHCVDAGLTRYEVRREIAEQEQAEARAVRDEQAPTIDASAVYATSRAYTVTVPIRTEGEPF